MVRAECKEWARWVPSHTDEKAIQEGRISRTDRNRNGEADKLAGDSISAHVDESGWEELTARRAAAKGMLEVVVGILAAATQAGVEIAGPRDKGKDRINPGIAEQRREVRTRQQGGT